LRHVVIDIGLDLMEQSLSDRELSNFAPVKARDAVHKARGMRRLERADDGTIFVYRLPVMIDWEEHPRSLQAMLTSLEETAATNSDNVQCVIWTENFSIRSKVLTDPGGRDITNDVKLDTIRQDEFEDFLRQENVLFEHAGSALFLLPSEQISDYFLRVGNLQSRQQFFAATFFWMIEELKEIRHIFCDTWSISTTAAVSAEFLNTYRRSSDKVAHTSVGWSFSPSYLPKSSLKSQLVFEAIYAAQQKKGQALFLSSFYSSGGLQEAIADQLLEFDARDGARLVAIFAVGSTFELTDQVLCDVSEIISGLGLKGKEGKYSTATPILEVSKVSFFPDYRHVETRPFLRKDIERNKDFLRTYVGRRIFSVHRDGRSSPHAPPGQPRHHAFHVDLAALFAQNEFQTVLSSKLAQCPPFTCIVRDSSDGAKALEAALRQARPELTTEAKCFEIDDWRLVNGQDGWVGVANANGSRTLVLVPAVITGQGIGDIKEQLRHTILDRTMKNLHFLVGLLRPEDPATIKHYVTIGENWVGPSKLTVCETLFLPNWGRDECPWCIEQNVVSQTKGMEKIDEKVRNRLIDRHTCLELSSNSGLFESEVFFTVEPNQQLPFNRGSHFVEALQPDKVQEEQLKAAGGLEAATLMIDLVENSPVSEADLCLTVANAVQNWRLRNPRTSLQRLTIDAATVSNDDKFNEARLRAAIWRTLSRSERALSVRASKEFANLVSRIYSENDDTKRRCLELEGFLAFGPEISRHFDGDVKSFAWSDFKWICEFSG
jgi:hypothetical protein